MIFARYLNLDTLQNFIVCQSNSKLIDFPTEKLCIQFFIGTSLEGQVTPVVFTSESELFHSLDLDSDGMMKLLVLPEDDLQLALLKKDINNEVD